MRNIAFYASVGKKFDDAIARAFGEGCAAHSADCRVIPTAEWAGQVEDVAVAVVVGVKDKSGPIFKAYRKAGRRTVFIDKGYARIRGGPLGTLYWRVSVDDFQPLRYFQATPRPSDRWDRLGWPIVGERVAGENVLFAGSSQKFCNWHELGNATVYARTVLQELARHTRRPIVYRPKPSWTDKVPVQDFGYSGPEAKFEVELANAHALVTFGSNACFEALLHGVPCIVLGNGITQRLSATRVDQVEQLELPPLAQTTQLAYDLAHCQWTLEEMQDGQLWANILEILGAKHARRVDEPPRADARESPRVARGE